MSMVRQPVPGVHDLIPPEGRVCVELVDDRGRVRQKVKSHNAIMNFWNEAQKRQVRGGDVVFTGATAKADGYHFHGATVLPTELDTGAETGVEFTRRALQDGQSFLGHPAAFGAGMSSVILTNSTDAVDPDEFIFPGNMAAYTFLREQYAPAVNLKRGNMNTTTSYRTHNSLRYVCEWGTAYGNGTHNSVGIGNTIAAAAVAGASWQCLTTYTQFSGARYPNVASSVDSTTAASGSMRADHLVNHGQPYRNFISTAVVPGTQNTSILSGHYVSMSEMWTVQSGVASNNLGMKNMTLATTGLFVDGTAASGHTVIGPTNTTIGAGTNKVGVTVIGADLWLAYQGTLKRCVKPTNTSLTVTDTYTPGGIETCVDITTDGTDVYWLGATTVYQINATTGAITSSWAHGLTGTMHTLCWGGPDSPYLLVSYEATAFGSIQTNLGYVARTQPVTQLFTVAGVSKGSFSVGHMIASTANVATTTGGLIMPLTPDFKNWVGPSQNNANLGSVSAPTYALGPSHMSRTLLGAPVVKTSSFSMRVTYEFTF